MTGTISTALRALATLAAFAALVLLTPSAAEANGRVALLIGNNAYPTSPLRNAVNDSRGASASSSAGLSPSRGRRRRSTSSYA